MKTRIVTFNVCGLKGLLSRASQWVPQRSLEAMFGILDAQIICFQETKIQIGDLPKDLSIVKGYNAVFTSVIGRRGYDGVAFYVSNSIRILKAEEGLTGWLRPQNKSTSLPYRRRPDCIHPDIYPEELTEKEGLAIDGQGRSLTLDLGSCVIIGLYCPADSQGNMSEYREAFFQLLDWRVYKLRELGREVIIVGDLNVAREPRDSASICEEYRQRHIIIDKSEWMYGSVHRKAVNDWIGEMGFQDSTRLFHTDREEMFTCWDQQKNCRPANFGSRIDYILVSQGIPCLAADIMPELVGSDHCPVYAEVELEVEEQGTFALPRLAKRVTDKWEQSIVTLFQQPSKRKAAEIGRPSKLANTAQSSTAQPGTIKSENTAEFDNSLSKAEKTSVECESSVDEIATNNSIPSTPVKVVRPIKQASISSMFGAKSPQWQQYNSKLVEPPKCEHGDHCIKMKSKKPPHKGQWFWICKRPTGGKTNTDKKFRCRTFVWDSERKE